jgi:tellurite resistance protein TerC
VAGHEFWIWPMFFGIVILLLVLDLGVLNKKDHEIEMAESLRLSVLYIGAGCLFGGWVWWHMGAVAGMDYFTGFFVEKSLSMDNVFVISLIFSGLHIPRIYQHRVLFWGILGAIIMRAVMIGVGAALVERFEWILYLFGIFLLFTGVKMLLSKEKEQDIEQNRMLRYLRTHLRMTPVLHEQNFLVKQPDTKGKLVWFATPLLLALLMVEVVDLIFAVDSIPAIFAITQDPFIVYTSNIFAILGLRALYFALAAMIHRFEYLKYALAVVLIFIGVKISLISVVHIPSLVSLAVTIGVLLAGIGYSLYKTRL